MVSEDIGFFLLVDLVGIEVTENDAPRHIGVSHSDSCKATLFPFIRSNNQPILFYHKAVAFSVFRFFFIKVYNLNNKSFLW